MIAVCALIAGGLAAVFLAGGHGSGRPAAVDGFSVTAGATPKALAAGSASPLMPQVAASPHVATMPKSTKRATGSAGAGHGSAKASGSPSAPGQPTSSGQPAPSGGGGSGAPVTSGSSTCTHPSFTTSATNGMWNLSPYFVSNNEWNAGSYPVTQTLYACSYSDWYVTATMNNDSGDGAVKTYPNSQRDFSDQISSLSSVTSTFAQSSPDAGIYEDAYDIWLNGLATSGSTELMIWTQNHGQTPSGSVQGTVTLGGRSYTVWKSGSYIAFVASSNFSSGTMNLLGFFQYIIGKGWIPSSSTLSQVCYGVELVSTNSAPATFSFSDFSVSAS